MKKALVYLGVILSCIAAQAQRPAAASIEFEYTTFNYDTVEQGSNGLCTFIFRNTGSEPLIITGASSSCGCTTPEYSKTPVLPGKTGRIKVKYNTETLGSFRKTVVVKSNAANAPTSVLRIKGFVREKKVQRSQKRRS